MTEHESSLRSACVPVVFTIAAIWFFSCIGLIALTMVGAV